MMDNSLPTSDLKKFEYQLNNPNQNIKGEIVIQQNIQKLKKNIVLAYPSDSTGCGHIRCIFPMNYLNAIFGGEGDLVPFLASSFIYQHDILTRTRSIFFQRNMNPLQYKHIVEYKNLQSKYGYKMVYDLDDFIWSGKNDGECIPDYNLASTKVGMDLAEMAVKMMELMDVICVSTQFLKDYLINVKNIKVPIVVVQNTVSKYFWFTQGKRPKIKNKIEKPRIIYTGSPAHYCNFRKMKGDWDNAWSEYIIKNVRENKIDFLVMGGLPYFFESLKNKNNFHVIDWLNSYQYHLPIIKYKPDFGVAPLVNNYFNKSKSALKLYEYSAVGSIAIGTTFSNGDPSPYDNNVVSIPDNCTVSDIEALINHYCEPGNFNNVIEKQYQYLDINDHWTESKGYIEKITQIL